MNQMMEMQLAFQKQVKMYIQSKYITQGASKVLQAAVQAQQRFQKSNFFS